MTRTQKKKPWFSQAALALAAVCLAGASIHSARAADVANAQGGPALPLGIPQNLYQFVIPKDNPPTPEKIALGKQLFFDTRLSADGTVSCSTCHDREKGFVDRFPTSKGIHAQFGKRNAPTAMNAMFQQTFFLDGRAPSLEEQAKLPIVNPIEMGMKDGAAVTAKVASIPEYVSAFNAVFHQPVSYDNIGRAIASFERTLVFGNSPFDRFIAGDANAMNESQRRGWTLFNGKGRCMSCHGFSSTQPFFTDNRFHNIGIAAHKANFVELAVKARRMVETGNIKQIDELAIQTDLSELGRFLVTKNYADTGAFKTSALRNIALTAPYMHDGSLPTLWDVIDHYNKGGIQNPFLDGGMQRLGLSENEIDDLVAFLGALTSNDFKAEGDAELQRQKELAATKRPERDTDAAMGRKGNLGDVAPDPDLKDPALIGRTATEK
ncbi:MAG TPA: cytochrome c peroxidase [Bryobacteraceae bacterium]|nr:cytochrome c peroxidase [Bryobacteraceae bacterium]